MHFIDLSVQTRAIQADLIERFKTIMTHGAYIMGPEVGLLESQLATFVGVKHALTMASGTDALLVALMALGVGRGDEVITTPFSFFATAEVIALLGAVPVFVDIDPRTYNIDPERIKAVITPRTKVIIPVSLYGQCPDMDRINAIASLHGLAVIEDAAQSFGATYHGKRSGGLTTIGCTSFFPTKPLGCFGDGGACFTNDDELATRMQEIRVHGQSARYYHTQLGINGRFDTLQAAVLLEKLPLFEEEIKLRQAVAARYKRYLPASVTPPYVSPDGESVYAQYTIEVADRADIQKALQAEGVPSMVHYPLGLHEQPIFKSLYPSVQSFPHTERAARRVLSLPMHPYLTEAEQSAIGCALEHVLSTETSCVE